EEESRHIASICEVILESSHESKRNENRQLAMIVRKIASIKIQEQVSSLLSDRIQRLLYEKQIIKFPA
ncbi:hypothetical protein MKW98_010271, partial [Papaver atlanticum]